MRKVEDVFVSDGDVCILVIGDEIHPAYRELGLGHVLRWPITSRTTLQFGLQEPELHGDRTGGPSAAGAR
ncbi:hypothetical protein ABZX90_35815 [Streptomyces sp. NPDC002935]|uniref:hypothetical protein n=1 Tax=unclassified Streptomyces TaxID=2593676 RepID=UPI00331B110A